MILDEDDGEARRRALRAGADDYVLAPLTAELLFDRIAGHGQVTPPAGPAGRLVHGGLTLDLAAHQVRWEGRPVSLRPIELRLLAHFVEHPTRYIRAAR